MCNLPMKKKVIDACANQQIKENDSTFSQPWVHDHKEEKTLRMLQKTSQVRISQKLQSSRK